MRDDHRVIGQDPLHRPQLPRQRQGRVLLVIGGGPPGERHPHHPHPGLNGAGVGVGGLIRAASAAYTARCCPSLDEFRASHTITSRNTWACRARSRRPSTPSTHWISTTTSGSSAGTSRPLPRSLSRGSPTIADPE